LRAGRLHSGRPGHLTVAGQSFSNASTSLFQAKSEGYIEDVLASPLRPSQLALAYMNGGLLRGFGAAGAVAVLAAPFADEAAKPWVSAIALVFTGVIFSALGVITGIWADSGRRLGRRRRVVEVGMDRSGAAGPGLADEVERFGWAGALGVLPVFSQTAAGTTSRSVPVRSYTVSGATVSFSTVAIRLVSPSSGYTLVAARSGRPTANPASTSK